MQKNPCMRKAECEAHLPDSLYEQVLRHKATELRFQNLCCGHHVLFSQKRIFCFPLPVALDGYNQLNRYCIHLDEDNNYNVRYAYLYMFYAHSDSFVDIKSKADSYCKEFLADFSYKETEKFRQHYKNTIFDNIVDIVV